MDNVNKIITDSLDNSSHKYSALITSRINHLLQWAQSLRESQAENDPIWLQMISMIEYQCRCAKKYLQIVRQLPGVTGETNELWLEPRGDTAIIIDDSMPPKAITAALTATLVSGNKAALFIDGSLHSYQKLLLDQLLGRFIKASSVQVQAFSNWAEVIIQPHIKVVCIAGKDELVIHANQMLAKREGPIASLVYDTYEMLPVFSDESFCINFNTEKTCTINTAAIGGNASLLEMSTGKN